MHHENNNKNNTLSKKTEDNDENENENEDNPDTLYEEFFNYFLQNKRGALNIKECKNAMRCLGLVVTEKEIQNYFGKEFDGRIFYAKLAKILLNNCKMPFSCKELTCIQ